MRIILRVCILHTPISILLRSEIMDTSKLGKLLKKGNNFRIFSTPLKSFERALMELSHNGIERISTISGVDTGKQIDVLYHFVSGEESISLKIILPRKDAKIKTIKKSFPGAVLYERELSEMLGVKIIGNESPKNILLDKESPKNPLRKSP